VSQPTDAVAVVPVTSSIYVGVADVDATVNMYLHDRLPEATSDNGLEVQPAIVSAASASARWTRIEVGGERNTLANGVIYLRNEGGTWHVTSSTVDAISVDDLRYRGGLLVGTATTTDDLNDSLAVDVLSLDGVPVEGSPNPTGYPGSTFLYGTAGTGTGKVEFGVSISSPVVVRVSLIGGNRLAVSEFVVDPASGPPSAG
jgi:hypothetical protein